MTRILKTIANAESINILIDAFIERERDKLTNTAPVRKVLESLADAYADLWQARQGTGLTLQGDQLQEVQGLAELKPLFKKLYPIGNNQSALAMAELVAQGKGFDASYARYLDAARMVLAEVQSVARESSGASRNMDASFTAKIETFCRKLDVECRKQAAPEEDVKSLTPQWADRLKSKAKTSKGRRGGGGRGED